MKRPIKSIVSSLILLALFLAFSTKTTNAQIVLFEDDFEDNLEKWEPVYGELSKWELKDGMIGTAITSSDTIYGLVPKNQYWSSEWNDYIFEFDFLGRSGVDKNFSFRFLNTNSWYEFHHTTDQEGWLTLYLDKVGPGGRTIDSKRISPIDNQGISNNIKYHIRIILEHNNFKFCIAENKKAESCILNAQDDNSPILTGKIVLKASTGSIYPTEVWFDNIKVTALGNNFNLNVPDIKQYDSRWGNLQYDHSLANNNTISRWGCALTSSTMILQYYGYNTDPSQLNDWLKQHPGAFNNAGGIVWPFISKYAHEHKGSSLPDLEFRYTPADETIVQQYLNNSRPVILKYSTKKGSQSEKMHFVVAKGKNESGFFINDPGSSSITNSNTIPSSYGMSFNSVGLLTPSSTDLSYLVFLVDSQIEMRVYNQNNQLITSGYQFEPPFVDPLTQEASGKTITAFYHPKPSIGQYKLVLNSSSSYTGSIEAHFFTASGENKYINLPISLNGTDTQSFIINYTSNINNNTIYPVESENEDSLDNILSNLDIKHQEGKIINNAYIAIKVSLINAKKYQNSKRPSLYKLYIKIAYVKLDSLTQKHIDAQYAQQLKESLQLLIKV